MVFIKERSALILSFVLSKEGESGATKIEFHPHFE